MDGVHPSCTDSGNGTEQDPFCTIGGALLSGAGPGTTILVHPGVYREQVNVTQSGASGAPLEILAMDGVVLDGADDLSSPENWLPLIGGVLQAPAVTREPVQVFADGVRLLRTELPVQLLPVGTFKWVPGLGLVVNIGGGDLTGRQLFVGARDYGFRVSGVSHVTIRGFSIVRSEDRGIYVKSGCQNVLVEGNGVAYSGRFGIQLDGSSSLVLQGNRSWGNGDHGIHMTSVDGSIVESNESFRNARLDERAGNGMMVRASSQNTIRWNRLHHNQDSGMQIDTGGNDNLLVRNMSWLNGDHGFDHLQSTGNIHVGEIAWGNHKDGYSIEGDSTDTRIYDSISADNGATTGRYDLFVDLSSVDGFDSDYNIFWNAAGGAPVRHGVDVYLTVAGYAAATGLDAASLEMDPQFIAPASGNLRSLPSGPGIDAADSTVPGWTGIDADGLPAFDHPSVEDTGIGPTPFADRGALESAGGGLPPTARLHVDMPTGTSPFSVVLDATASGDPDDAIVAYLFDTGDGTLVGPQATPAVSHTYGPGIWTVKVTVTDEASNEHQALGTLVVTEANRPPDGTIDGLPGTLYIDRGQSVSFAGTAMDPDGDTPIGYAWDFGGVAPPSTLQSPGPVVFETVGSFLVTLSVTDSRGLRDPTPASVNVTVRPPISPDGKRARFDKVLND